SQQLLLELVDIENRLLGSRDPRLVRRRAFGGLDGGRPGRGQHCDKSCTCERTLELAKQAGNASALLRVGLSLNHPALLAPFCSWPASEDVLENVVRGSQAQRRDGKRRIGGGDGG